MKLYFCCWPNRSVTLCHARSIEAAIEELDEIGDASECLFIEAKGTLIIDFENRKLERRNIQEYKRLVCFESESLWEMLHSDGVRRQIIQWQWNSRRARIAHGLPN